MKALPAALEKFLDIIRNTKSAATSRQYYYDLLAFVSWIEKHKGAADDHILHSLTINDYQDYLQDIAERGSDALVRRKTSILNQWLKHQGYHRKLEPPADKQRPLTNEDFVSPDEIEQLVASMRRSDHRSPDEANVWEHLKNRNLFIITLLYNYGLTVREACDLNMEDINLSQGDVRVLRDNGAVLRFTLAPDERKQLLSYYHDIPENIRPRRYSDDPLFVAFSYSKRQYKLDYTGFPARPKRIGVAAIHKMIKLETRRANLRPISATNMRNARILKHLKAGKSDEEVLKYFGLSNWRALIRYKKYLQKKS
jgi:site-specific recombinase XerD